LLGFAERNPGITRILTGDALAGETERLHVRVAQLFDRFETQLKQVLREAEMREGLRPVLAINTAANLLLATAEGRISQYVRSGFQRAPTEGWADQWQQLIKGFFRTSLTTQEQSAV
jgi:TetR/AcrR family transcriptional regulator